MNIEIDPDSGFCFGVVYAIQMAEAQLEMYGKLYCLGDIVHNNVEVSRLVKKGLISINHEQLMELHNCTVLLRAHGEPPETYKIALENNIELIDASCPVVLKLQNNIKKGFDLMRQVNGQIVIYGKDGHAEVNGLVGQTQGLAVVINDISDLEKVDFTRPITLFSQTTKSIEGFQRIQEEILIRMKQQGNNHFISNNTICRQVSGRDKVLRKFAKKHDVIIFVSGKKSSNGKMLFDVCKEENQNTYFVSELSDVNSDWFNDAESVGVCGATSSPRWLMEEIAVGLIKSIESDK